MVWTCVYTYYVYPLCLLCSADGYCRSEGVVALYLQRGDEAKKVYYHVIHSGTNNDGNKEQGINEINPTFRVSMETFWKAVLSTWLVFILILYMPVCNVILSFL